jgi:glutaredoxin 3
MSNQRRIEVFSAGCPACEPVVDLVKSLACPACQVEVLDMRQPEAAARAERYGVKAVPAVVVDGRLLPYGSGSDAVTLRAAGLGQLR